MSKVQVDANDRYDHDREDNDVGGTCTIVVLVGSENFRWCMNSICCSVFVKTSANNLNLFLYCEVKLLICF